MTTIDFRIRPAHDDTFIELGAFIADRVPALPAHNAAAAGEAARRLGLPPLTLDIEGAQLTFLPTESSLAVRPGTSEGVVVTMDAAAFSDLVQDIASTFGLTMTRRAQVRRGEVDTFVEWEPVLRCLLDGRAVYRPGTIDFHDQSGRPLDLRRSFTLDDDPTQLGHFLAQAGFLHVRSVFSAAEMAEVSADLDDAIGAATRDDGESWWARTESAGWYPARILGFDARSATLRALLRGDRFTALGNLTDDRYEQRDPDAGDAAEGLLKKVGVVQGASDVSWHKDCSMGGHSRICCGLVVGISITGAGSTNGELGVVAGSHRANVAPLGVEGLDLPRLALPTHTGDITVHCTCTLHMSRPPISAERRVVYTGFALAARPGHDVAEVDDAERRRRRVALNDYVIADQDRNRGSARLAGREL